MITLSFSSTSGEEGEVVAILTPEDLAALDPGSKPMDPTEAMYCEGHQEERYHQVGPIPDGTFVPFVTDGIGTYSCALCWAEEFLSYTGMSL